MASTLGINQIGDGQNMAVNNTILPESIDLLIDNHDIVTNSYTQQKPTQTANNNSTIRVHDTNVNNFVGTTRGSTEPHSINTSYANGNETSRNDQQLLGSKLEVNSIQNTHDVPSNDVTISNNSNEVLIASQNDNDSFSINSPVSYTHLKLQTNREV